MLVDKSYLQGTKTEEIHKVCNDTTVFISDAFLYEVLKSKPKDRVKIMKKFPSIDSKPCYKVLPNVNELLSFEVKKHQPVVSALELTLRERDYSLHRKLVDEKYILEHEYSKVLEKKKKIVDQGAGALLSHIHNFGEMYKFLIDEAKKKGINTEEFIVSDFAVKYIGAVIKMLFDNDMSSNGKKERFPKVQNLTPNWYTYRFIQVYNLISLDVISRYENLIVIVNSDKAKEKLRHDYLDLEYLLWGLQLGAFVTKENKLNRWFKLLTR